MSTSKEELTSLVTDESQLAGFVPDGKTVVTASSKYNSDGQARCRLCSHCDDILVDHIQNVHGLEVSDYQRLYSGWPLFGEASSEAGQLRYKERDSKLYSVHETFGFYWSNETGVDKPVKGYVNPGPYTPPIDPHYVFPPEETEVLLAGLDCKDKILVSGPTGCGKTSGLEQMCARLNYNFIRIPCNGSMKEEQLIGQYILQAGKVMVYLYGLLSRAIMLPGTVVVLDEWDATSDEITFIFQPVLENLTQIVLMDKGEEILTMHPDNVIVATGNTLGMGDDTGQYSAGTNNQNTAQRNRFGLTILYDYLPPALEKKILRNHFPNLKSGIIDAIITGINLIRTGHTKTGTFSEPLSTRDAINWAGKSILWADPYKAARYCWINRMPIDEREEAMELVQRAFSGAVFGKKKKKASSKS